MATIWNLQYFYINLFLFIECSYKPALMKNIFILIVLILLGANCGAQVFSAPVGIATVVTPGEYNLTPASMCGGGHKGAVWCTTTIDFSVSFVLTYQASFDQAVGIGADGIAVVFGQNITPTSINFTDAYLGYYNVIGGPSDPDFNNSIGVEFDIYDNTYLTYFDDIPGTDHTAVCLNAVPTTPVTGPIAISPSTTNIKDGAFHDYKITWCPLTHTLQVFYNDTLRLNSVYDYASVFTSPTTVHWGFSGGTGAACSNQIIKNISLVTGTFCAPPPPCQVNSLIINTGYDPVTGLAIVAGANGATPVPDPKWALTSVATGVAAAITGTPIPGLMEVVPGNKADIIQPLGGYWATNPLGNPGGWISCLNSNVYYDCLCDTPYYMTLGRTFKMCNNDSIKLELNIANDNYISATDIDGIPLPFFQTTPPLTTYFSTFANFTQTVYLTAGTHTIHFKINNWNLLPGAIPDNPTGLDVYGTVSSSTGIATLLSETDTMCTCGTVVITCDSLSMPDSVKLCKNSTYTIPVVLYGTNPALSFLWSPATGLSSSTILNPLLTANASGWYHLTVNSITSGNLIVNGDFSSGNTGFTSPDYTYLATIPISNEYTITTDIFLADPGLTFHFYDHTSPPTGNFLAINGGNPAANTRAWQETVPVTAGTSYQFNAWYAYWTYDPTGLSNPNLYVEITPTGSGTTSIDTFAHLTSSLVWMPESYLWTAPVGATGAIIRIIDQNSAYFYNDFCLDDISFKPLCIAKDSIYVLVAPPDTTFKSVDTSICSTEGSMSLHAPSGISWLWSLGNTTQDISVNLSGTYWVNIIRGCDSMLSDTFHVAINPVPVVKLRSDTSVCDGIQVVLGSPEPHGVAYNWSTGSTDSSIKVSVSGTYILRVTDQGCTRSDSMKLTTISKPAPIFLGPDTVLCKGEEITISTNTNNTVWSNGETGKSIIISISGVYYAVITNQCGITSDTLHVDVEPCDLWFPTAFSPNGDNLNDYARVVGDLKMIRNFSLSIYNRWGERVFHTTDIYAGWDGEYKGVKQDLGTFFYMINYTLQGKSHLLKGDLTLIR